MKKIIKILVFQVIMMITAVSCNFLDVIPDNLPTIDDAFSNRAAARKSLFSCYSYLPDPYSSCFYHPAYFTNRDEFEYSTDYRIENYPASRIARGEQNSNTPLLDYWRGTDVNPCIFKAIRTCNIFLEGIHQPRDMRSEKEREKWIAEAKFLKAYYHFFLLQLYGPIPIVRENIPLSATPDEVQVFREPVDECIAYIVELLDEAAPDLPLTVEDPVEEDGRITRPIALAVKAKVLAWGASPLFNGNEDYRDWRDSRGKQLISDVYSREKWVQAAEAIREAIEVCDEANHHLYRYNKASNAKTYRMNDSLLLTMHTRKAVTDRWNLGIVWSSSVPTHRIGYLNDLQAMIFPPIDPLDLFEAVSYANVSFNMAELFYTNNGIPIDEDNQWDYEGRYNPKLSTVDAKNGNYIALGQQTASLHFDREARFYANLCFDRGYVELAQTTNNGGYSFTYTGESSASYTPVCGLRQGDVGSGSQFNSTGYYAKKLAAFETKTGKYSAYNYLFPLLRLSDLYLLYSEALNEVKDRPDSEVYEWIDQVRDIVGLQGVVDSWKNSKYPNRPSEKTEMRKIIQQERLIELAFEGQRFYDMRRWKLAEKSWAYNPVGWNKAGKTAEEYYTVVNLTTEPRKYSYRDYLWPIALSELWRNPNLVQTFGW